MSCGVIGAWRVSFNGNTRGQDTDNDDDFKRRELPMVAALSPKFKSIYCILESIGGGGVVEAVVFLF